jgi:NAD(P)-dependent dehydrogenase (short-subunit alcohol dehydrogenase family)
VTRFDGSACIVTGAGSGIGRATAELLAAEGGQVLAVDIEPSRVQETVQAIKSAGGRASGLVADVALPDAPAAVVDAALAAFGRIDVLCNVAGIGLWKPIASTTRVEWDRVIGVNVASVYFLTQAVAPSMRSVGGGSIVNIASVHSFASWPECGVYAASKGAVLALTRSLALELVDWGIRVNAIAPGTTDTRMVRDGLAEASAQAELEAEAATIPLGRLGRADEIAAAVAFLASPDSSFAVGACLLVDGGMTARL